MTELSHTMYDEGGHEEAMTQERINCHHNFTQVETHFDEQVW